MLPIPSKRGLIVIGDDRTLRNDSTWSSWLDWVSESNLMAWHIVNSWGPDFQRNGPSPAWPSHRLAFTSQEQWLRQQSLLLRLKGC